MKNIKSIRPNLSLSDIGKKPIELFQNETLRPILKFQQELTRSLLENHQNYKPDQSSNVTRQQFESFLLQYIQTNLDLKNQLIGTLIGLLSTAEISFYYEHRKELNKRMIQMQLKRFVDTIYTELVLYTICDSCIIINVEAFTVWQILNKYLD